VAGGHGRAASATGGAGLRQRQGSVALRRQHGAGARI
jgi:hypothetical protein